MVLVYWGDVRCGVVWGRGGGSTFIICKRVGHTVGGWMLMVWHGCLKEGFKSV